MNFQRVFFLINDYLKKIILGSFICVFVTPLYAAWVELGSSVSRNLKAVSFPVDEMTGYAVGARGTIIKTTDGNSWKRQRSGVRAHLKDVHFVNNKLGFAVGTKGTLLKTRDGGRRWKELDSDTDKNLFSVYFLEDGMTGYIGGASSTLLKTTDGGESWDEQSIDGGYVYEIVFPDDDMTGFASAIYGTLGFVYKTTDGGMNWNRVLVLEDASIKSMSFPNGSQVGYLANNDNYWQSGIWKTVDGGDNWNFVSQGITAVPMAIDFTSDGLRGIAVGRKSAVINTVDAGSSWTEGGLGGAMTLHDIQVVADKFAYAVGDEGAIYKLTMDISAPSPGPDPAPEPTPVSSFYLHPTAMGSTNTFTGMSGCSQDWDCVNDQAGNAGSGLPEKLDATNYVADGSGNRVMFSLDDGMLPANQLVSEICISLAATQTTGPMASLSYQRLGVDSMPVDSQAFWVGSYWFNGISTWCWQDLNWSSSDLDALEIGLKTVDGQWLEASQLYVKVFVFTP